MGSGSSEFVRDVAALVVAAVACPAALFAGALLGCASQGLTSACAMQGAAIGSPIILFAAGVLAGLLTYGWTGLLFVSIGVVAGMISIPVIATAIGNPVPLDPVQGVIATFWFFPPVTLGYGVVRGIARLLPSRGRGGSGSADS